MNHDEGYGASSSAGSFRRAVRSLRKRMVCFLPYGVSRSFAANTGLVPPGCSHAVELPDAMLSANPRCCAEAIRAVAEAAIEDLLRHGPKLPLIIGQSLGSVPAAIVANALQTRLLAIASADYGHRMIWESAAALPTRVAASALGVERRQFARALRGLNPIENLSGLSSGSCFVNGDRDYYVPAARWRALHLAVRKLRPEIKCLVLPAGHISTLYATMRAFNRDA